MAQTLAERFKAAKSPRARIADSQALVADAKAEHARLIEVRDKAARDSVDFALSEGDRDEAAGQASRHDRTAQGLVSEISALEALIAARRDSDAQKAAEAERAAAIVERDELAARFAEFIPGTTTAMIELFAAVERNAQRLSSLGIREGDAEAKARGVKAFLGLSSDPERFLAMKIPDYAGVGRSWPVDQMRSAATASTEQLHRTYAELDRQKSPEAREKREAEAKRQAEDHARTHGLYRVSTGLSGFAPAKLPLDMAEKVGKPPLPRGIFISDPWQGELRHDQAERLKSVPNLTVKALPPPQAPQRRGAFPLMGSF